MMRRVWLATSKWKEPVMGASEARHGLLVHLAWEPRAVNAEGVVLGTVTLPGLKRSVADARGFLRELLAPGEVLDDLTLVGSELVGNASTHTGSRDDGKVTVTVVQGPGGLLLEVTED